MTDLEKVAKIVEENPDCEFQIDNDCWYIMKAEKDRKDDDDDCLASSSQFKWNTDWYGHSSNYGSALSEVLIFILNKKGFNIKASAV